MRSANSSSSQEFIFKREHFDQLRKIAKGYAGISVGEEKFQMYYTRLSKRLRSLGMTSFDQYVEMVKHTEAELPHFINAITTNVTAFGREQHHFDFLKDLLKTRKGGSFAIWSAGCSSGEEPYSIVLNLLPICQRQGIKLTILATDLDTDVLNRASRGVYPLDAIKHYDLETKRRFFLKGTGSQNGLCRVKPLLRELITFRQLNLISSWSHPTPFDAIFCRNVMIYFDMDDKKRIIERYANSLVQGGFLFLGHSESLHKVSERFDNVGKTIYAKQQ